MSGSAQNHDDNEDDKNHEDNNDDNDDDDDNDNDDNDNDDSDDDNDDNDHAAGTWLLSSELWRPQERAVLLWFVIIVGVIAVIIVIIVIITIIVIKAIHRYDTSAALVGCLWRWSPVSEEIFGGQSRQLVEGGSKRI